MEVEDNCNSMIRTMGEDRAWWICDVEIEYQVGSMREFRCGDPFRFLSSIFIP